MHLKSAGDPEIATRIASYEMAYRMQSSVPDLVGHFQRTAVHPRAVRHRAGQEILRQQLPAGAPAGRARRALRAALSSRLGQPRHLGHDDIVNRLPQLCRETDRAAAALVNDLKQRGLLDSTLVVWGGEFGRTPMNEARNRSKFLGATTIPAPSRVDGRRRYQARRHVGQTDELGYNIVEDPVDVHDLHATILHLMGIDHTKLTYRFQGRDFRLTDVSGNVIRSYSFSLHKTWRRKSGTPLGARASRPPFVVLLVAGGSPALQGRLLIRGGGFVSRDSALNVGVLEVGIFE